MPVLLLTSIASSCAQNSEIVAICNLAESWNQASREFAEISSDLETTSPGRLQEVFGNLTSTLGTMSEIGPVYISDSIESLLVTYQSFSMALESLDWQSGLIGKDAAATSASVRLASDEIVKAQTALGNFIDSECQIKIENPINKLPDVGTTLPDPLIQDETKEQPDVGLDNEQSVYSSFGFLVVERFGVAITNEQALCIGTSLASKNLTNNPNLDANYWNVLQKTFDECFVSINIAEFLSK